MKNKSFYYKKNQLFVENIQVDSIIHKLGTPTYIYSQASFINQLVQLKNAFKKIPHLICYSLKVCHNINVIRLFVENGCGLDIVSGGELYRAIKSGCDVKRIVYSGVGKTEQEIKEAVEAGILMLNIESEQELERINNIGRICKKQVPIAIRVNPNIDAKTHPYITTGLRKNKFGIDHKTILPLYKKAVKQKYIKVVGIDCHIGSQLLQVKPYNDAALRIAEYIRLLKKEGIDITYVDMGGGLGIPYKQKDNPIDIEEYAQVISKTFTDFPNITIILEPGRFLTALGGVLVTKVQYIKQNSYKKKFIIVDTGMHHIIRPPLYGGFHSISPIIKKKQKKQLVDIVGPICESTDFLVKGFPLENVKQDDLLSIANVGAYCMVLSSQYNSHPRPAEVLVNGSKYSVIRKRETYKDMLCNEIF